MSLLLGVSEATLDLLVPIQSLGSLFDTPWAGLEFQVSRWKYISEGSELCQEVFWFVIFSVWHLLISFRDVPFLGQNNCKDACLMS